MLSMKIRGPEKIEAWLLVPHLFGSWAWCCPFCATFHGETLPHVNLSASGGRSMSQDENLMGKNTRVAMHMLRTSHFGITRNQ
jgi:hypothetical protein